MHANLSYLFIIVLIGWFSQVVAQVSNSDSFQYESIQVGVNVYPTFTLSSNYYPIQDNLPSVDFNATPKYKGDPKVLIDFIRNTPSYSFAVYENDEISYIISVQQENDEQGSRLYYHVINTANRVSIIMPCGVGGEIPQRRAEELSRISKAKLVNNSKVAYSQQLLFDKIYYTIQPYDSVYKEVVAIAHELVNPPEIEYGLSEDFIRAETIGGKLDFMITLKQEDRQLYVVDGTAYDKKSFAILLWGIAVKKMNVKSVKKAIALWEDINQRSLQRLERKALVMGYVNAEI